LEQVDILGGIAQQMQQQNVDVFLTNEDTFLRVESAIFSMVKNGVESVCILRRLFFWKFLNYQGLKLGGS